MRHGRGNTAHAHTNLHANRHINADANTHARPNGNTSTATNRNADATANAYTGRRRRKHNRRARKRSIIKHRFFNQQGQRSRRADCSFNRGDAADAIVSRR